MSSTKSRHKVLTIKQATPCTTVNKQKLQKSMSLLEARHFTNNWRDANTLVMENIRMARASFPIRSRRKKTEFTGSFTA